MSIRKKINHLILCTILCLTTAFSNIVTPDMSMVYAENDYMAKWEERKSLPIQTDEIPNWPKGPQIGAECAILMEMNTHTILYAKDINKKMYPASTTKILTCLLAMQNCNLDDTITFSHDSIYDVPVDGARVGWDPNGVFHPDDRLNLELALYCVLVKSANEVASAVGEHVAQSLGMEKSTAAFAELMNKKAKELGCVNSNFKNANGLFDEDLTLNEDDDFNFRLIEDGGKVYITPEIRSTYYPRDNYRALFRQYFLYGEWKVPVIKKHGKPARLSHLIPLFFFMFIVFGGLLSLVLPFAWIDIVYYSVLAIYLGIDIYVSMTSQYIATTVGKWRLVWVHFVLHFAYGLGFFVGIFKFRGDKWNTTKMVKHRKKRKR